MWYQRVVVLLVLSLLMFSNEVLAGNITYTYDNAGRLIKVDYGGGKTITYEYDNAGNLIKRTASATTSLFADVDPTSVFYDYIVAIYNRSITVGCGQNPLRYCPSEDVNRGQMAAFIIRAKFGENFTFTQTPFFTDVPANHTYFKYVQKMRDENITRITGTLYNVDQVVPREQMAAFIARGFLGMQ
ncbi:MAG: RHS repeat protein [Thermodesulfovibrionales bacterium]|nr:RHS repeat protein [Thermodesulfovibrionales bacterium]